MIYSFAPILAYSGIFLAWANGSYTNVWSPIYIFYFILMFALVFGGISTKIILAYLTRASYPGFTGLLLPPLLGAILANLDPS